MKKPPIPDALAMTLLKYGDASVADRERVARELAAAGRHPEAILLFEKQPEAPFLREEAARAIAEGDAFVLLAIRRIGGPVTEQDLRSCAASAEAAGRWLDARQCLTALADAEGLARIAPHLPPSLAPRPPVVPT